jgi:hypothetical protein
MGYGPYNKTNDIGKKSWQGMRHGNSDPKTLEDVESWLSDTSALPHIEAYRWLDPTFFETELTAAAERIHLDVDGGYYTISEAAERYYLRSQGIGDYAVREANGVRTVVTPVDLCA